MAPAQMFAWRPTRRSDTEELLLLGFEILVGDDALISELGEPFELAHVLGFVRSRGGSSGLSFAWFLAATKVFVHPKPALDERATPLHVRRRPVGLPCLSPLSIRGKLRVDRPLSARVTDAIRVGSGELGSASEGGG